MEHQNSAGIWKTVKGWLGLGSSGPPTQLFWEGKIVTSPIGLAESMNSFFLDKIARLRSNIPLTRGDPVSKLREAMLGKNCSFQFQEVKTEDVLNTIKNLKNSNSTGIDYIDTRTLKGIADIVAPSMTHIINLSIQSGIFPSAWKWAKVVPLLKSTTADKMLPKSYRPVALLPILSKVLEKVLFRQLVLYLEENNIVHPNLHGSRSGHDTSTALLQLYDKWVQEMEEDKIVGVLVCDQSAAFDLCDHSILLKKLGLMGLQEKSLNWVNSYLSQRKQSCFIDGELSSPLDMHN